MNASTDSRIPTKAEAIAASTTAATEVEGRGPMLHCQMSFTGADWELSDVLATIERATSLRWVRHWAGHDLGVMADGTAHYFDVKAPEGVL